MRGTLRRRFWLESSLATCAILLLLVTLVSRSWIELVFRVDPDQGSGALEWTVVACLLAFVVGLGALASYEWLRARTAARVVADNSAALLASASQE